MSRFRVECVVDDKNLAKLLRMLAGAGAYNVMPVPIVEASGKTNGAAPPPPTGKLPPKIEILWAKMQAAGMAAFTVKELQELMASEGLAKGSCNYALMQMKKAKLIKMGTARGEYAMKGPAS